ncbi:MAG: sigma-70 family RNA polymerase sigma factor [candidate division KSB1 bacterium]|nr:sigma-70 family RNA polymerase sigma factor [candidate division KSB1 bacterium]MDZ7346583.1 sigma-70 family RNA polymerase sigma factor [candidate division KSB1 bacterium]
MAKGKDSVYSDYFDFDALPDEELIRLFQNDELAAYDTLVRRYRDQLYLFAYRFLGNQQEAEDVVQETFLRLFRKRHAYRQIAKFSTWIYTIAGNLAKTELRRRKRRRLVSINDMGFDEKEFEIEDEGMDTEREADSSMTDKLIQQAISELSPRFREVIILRDIQELSYEEIGSILRIPLGTVKSRVNRARLKLQAKLKAIKPENK